MADDKKLIVKTAYMYFQEGRWDKAIGEFKRLVALDPEDLSARNMLADAYGKKGLMKEAYEEYAYAAEGYNKRAEGEKSHAIYKKMAKLEVGNLDAAQQKKQRVISLMVRGDSANEQGNYEEAAAAFQEVVNIDPENWDVVAKLAELFARMGKNKEAAAQYFAVAKSYQEIRLFKKALVLFQKVVEMEPSNVDARLSLGDLLAREGQELEARKEFQAVAEYFITQDQLDKAQQCIQKAIQLKSIDAHYLLGEILIKKGQFDEARTELEAFLKIKASHVQAQFSLGVCLLHKGSLDEALAIFGKIVGKQADHVDALEKMAEIYQKKGAVKDAVAQHLSLGQIFIGQRIMDRAEVSIRRALDLDQQNIDGYKKLGELFEMRGMKQEAGQAYLDGMKSAQAQNISAEAAICEQKVKAINPALLGVSAPVAEPAAAAAPAPVVAAAPVAAAPAPAPVPAAAAAPIVPVAPVSAAAPVQAPVPKPVAVAPAKPKTALSPEQQAKRLLSMAQSALRQNLYDEAVDFLQQAQRLMPEDQEIKAAYQQVLRGYAKGVTTPKAAAPTPAPVPKAPVESAVDMEARIRGQVEQEMKERMEREISAKAAAPSGPSEEEKRIMEETRRQIVEANVAVPQEPVFESMPVAPTPAPEVVLAQPAPSIPAAAPVPVQPAKQVQEDEHITETMAELYLSQGHEDEALRILTEILRKDPARGDLRLKISEIQTKRLFPSGPRASAAPVVPPAAVAAAPVRVKPRVSYV